MKDFLRKPIPFVSRIKIVISEVFREGVVSVTFQERFVMKRLYIYIYMERRQFMGAVDVHTHKN